MLTPVQVVENQLIAYNNHDIEAFCACFSDDVKVELLIEGELLFEGMEAFRATYAERFSNPGLHAKLINRIAQGRVVIDEEEVTGLPDFEVLYVVAIYEIEGGLIQKVRFERV
ncbi:nuclear transport factor 2 family protein [Kiloniella antarctica]|uniref:Nuclear transport factor 2 family protein n=1 Tax=Kiloniella antarctica TaxID=1550907 RepID=A0ABW5BS34_9PROT